MGFSFFLYANKQRQTFFFFLKELLKYIFFLLIYSIRFDNLIYIQYVYIQNYCISKEFNYVKTSFKNFILMTIILLYFYYILYMQITVTNKFTFIFIDL